MERIIVIGGGPIGMNAAIMAADQGQNVLLLESSEVLGGQLPELYPEKEIVDIPQIPCIQAQGYVMTLVKEIQKRCVSITVHMHEKALSIEKKGNLIHVTTSLMDYEAKAVVLATGLGTFIPRTMGLPNEEGTPNILYALQTLESLRGKRIVILGGGDSALDWAKMISRVSDDVSIVHRRREFRGDFATISSIKTIKIKTPFIPVEIKKNGNLLTELVIQNVETSIQETLEADFVFVNFGHIPSVESFGLEKQGIGIKVNHDYETPIPNVFAIGDVSGYEGKNKRIAPGLAEARHVIDLISKRP